MGQKVNPIGIRVAVTKDWRSRWFAGKKEFGLLVNEDIRIRDIVRQRLQNASIAEIRIERYANRLRVTIHTARPGIVIGRKGADIERVREEIAAVTKKETYIEIHEIKNPDLNAQLVAENIAFQLLRRVSFRRAMKRSIKSAMDMGADGIKIKVAGRLGGAELARTEWYKEGKVPLQTLRADIQYGFTEARTMAGKVGVKVWICLSNKKTEPERKGRE